MMDRRHAILPKPDFMDSYRLIESDLIQATAHKDNFDNQFEDSLPILANPSGTLKLGNLIGHGDMQMQAYSGMLWCVAWITGLLTTQTPWLTAVCAIVFTLTGIALRKQFRTKHQVQPWLIASAIVLMAVGWYHLRTPQPQVSDISRYVSAIDRQVITVTGTVEALPRTTRSGKTQLWLDVQDLDAGELNRRLKESPHQARGRLYVTIADRRPTFPPGTQVKLKGQLYAPKPAQNPGGFDFQKYLAIEGCFAGLKADDFDVVSPAKQTWGLWQVQQRITQSMLVGLPEDEGLLLAAMVLGNKAVDIPGEMQDAFTKVGMSHALAASGFQVSLIISVVLGVTDRLSKKIQVTAGVIALLLFIGLAGAQPAILRAGVMGFAVLLALALDQKVKPVESLLFASVVLLIYNPLWIWNLGFQLSALATLGLLVSSTDLQKKLDWIPTPIALPLATSIAAYLWTLPLQLFSFGLVSPYSIPINVVTTVLISVISLGGMIDALIAVIHSAIGSFCAGLLHYPIAALLWIVNAVGKLPGSQWAMGTVSIGVLIGLYGLLGLTIWRSRHVSERESQYNSRFKFEWIGIVVTAFTIVFVPALLAGQQTQITSLATTAQPVLVVQTQGKVLVVNTGNRASVENTLTSFFQKQGINKIDRLISLHPTDPDAIQALRDRIPVGAQLDLEQVGDQTLAIGTVQIQGDRTTQSLTLRVAGKPDWLLCRKMTKPLREAIAQQSSAIVLWWSGGKLDLPRIPLNAAIAYGKQMNPEVEAQIRQKQVPSFEVGQDGAVQWRGDRGFSKTSSREETEFVRL